MDIKLIKSRIKEAVGSDTQIVIAEKLSMTQGNVSKLLSSDQQPQLDTIYTIAEEYNVSVDWLLGLSNAKSINKSNEKEIDYAIAVEILHDLLIKKSLRKDDSDQTKYFLCDRILKYLVENDITLFNTDRDLYNAWKDTKLSLFKGKEILWPIAFSDHFEYEMANASNINDVLDAYDVALENQFEYEEFAKE